MRKYIIDPVGFDNIDYFYIDKTDKGTFVEPVLNDREVLTPKIREKSTKSLPVKTVLVKSKNPYLRTHQHYDPNKGKSLFGKKNLKKSEFKDLNAFISSLPETIDKGKFTGILHEYLKTANANKFGFTTSGLDIDKKINGVHLLSHIMAVTNNKHLIKTISNDFDEIPNGNSLIEKVAGFKFYTTKASEIPIEHRNAFLNVKLKKTVNSNLINHYYKQFKKHANSPESKNFKEASKNLTTLLDFALHIGGVDRTASVLKEIFKASGENEASRAMLKNFVSHSTNPKMAMNLLEKSGSLPKVFSGKNIDSELLKHWGYSTTSGVGVLIRRSLRSAIGVTKKSDFQDNYKELNHYHISEIDSENVPDNVLKSLQKIYSTTKKVLKHKKLDKPLYRGIRIPSDKRGVVRPTVSSSSIVLKTAQTFSGNRNPLFEKENNYIMNTSATKFVDSVAKSGSGAIIKYNTQKLIEDGKIFAVISPEYDGLYEYYGIKMPKNQSTENEAILAI